MIKFQLAMVTSLTAGLIILVVLILVPAIPLKSLFQMPLVLILWFLWILGVVTYRLLSNSNLRSSAYIRKYTPYSLALTLLFIVMGIIHQWLAMEVFLMAGYSFELVAGLLLYDDFKLIIGRGNALVFLVGISLFILSLPLTIFKVPWPAMAGVLLKTVSIARVITKAGSNTPIEERPPKAT
ncbi:hypothetical protein [Caldivirga sp.]|uniref:hypothetical protein n=1 Tax=Caldivirga sp. TaxID=2080243 RepID=UPI0025BE5213|nr:hypothetical protein [Caldivirga sp.]